MPDFVEAAGSDSAAFRTAGISPADFDHHVPP